MIAAGALVFIELLCACDKETLYPACSNADLQQIPTLYYTTDISNAATYLTITKVRYIQVI